MKTIALYDDGMTITFSRELTDSEKIKLAERLFGDIQTDNQGQYIVYTGIMDPDHEGDDDEG